MSYRQVPQPPAVASGALAAALLGRDRERAREVLHAAGSPLGAAGIDAVVVPALVGISGRWSAGQVAVSDLYLAVRLCRELVTEAVPPGGGLRAGQPLIALGVLEDSHVLGSQIVAGVLASAGYEASDWGPRLSVVDVVERVAREGTQVLLISVLMLRAALRVADLRPALSDRGLNPVLVVGGAPFRIDPMLAGEVGADHVGATATDVLAILAQVTGASPLRGAPWLS